MDKTTEQTGQDRYRITRGANVRRRGTGWVIGFQAKPNGPVRTLTGTYPDRITALEAADRLNDADRATRPAH